MDHMSDENFPSILNHALFCILHSSMPQCPHLQIFCACLAMCHALLLQNYLRIKSVLMSSSSTSLSPKHLWHHLQHTEWLHHSSKFLVTHFSSNDIGLHTIWILITLNFWFSIQERCNLILVCCVKSLIIILNPAHTCTNVSYFYYASLILTKIPISVMFYSFTIAFCKTG